MSEFVEALTDASREGGRSCGLHEAARIIDEVRFGASAEVFDVLTDVKNKIEEASDGHWQRSQAMFAALREPVRVREVEVSA